MGEMQDHEPDDELFEEPPRRERRDRKRRRDDGEAQERAYMPRSRQFNAVDQNNGYQQNQDRPRYDRPRDDRPREPRNDASRSLTRVDVSLDYTLPQGWRIEVINGSGVSCFHLIWCYKDRAGQFTKEPLKSWSFPTKDKLQFAVDHLQTHTSLEGFVQ